MHMENPNEGLPDGEETLGIYRWYEKGDITDRLSIMGSPVPDEEQAMVLLLSLPPSYDALVTILAKELEMASVVSGILEHEARTGGGSRQNDRALFVSTQGRTNQGTTSLCYNCNKPGHFSHECTAPKASNESSHPCQPNVPPRGGRRPCHHHRRAPKHRAKVATTDSGMEDSEFAFCTEESGNTGKKQGWIVDSGVDLAT